jgi:hypothetical protein
MTFEYFVTHQPPGFSAVLIVWLALIIYVGYKSFSKELK